MRKISEFWPPDSRDSINASARRPSPLRFRFPKTQAEHSTTACRAEADLSEHFPCCRRDVEPNVEVVDLAFIRQPPAACECMSAFHELALKSHLKQTANSEARSTSANGIFRQLPHQTYPAHTGALSGGVRGQRIAGHALTATLPARSLGFPPARE
jgi:hypothetical protein